MDISKFMGPIGSAVDGLFNFGSAAFANFQQRKMQREQNEFNANQAELNRQFQAQEAQIARDWQEQQYLLYSSPSAMVRQYEEAGLNPALMYGQNLQSSTGSSPMPSSSAASGSTPVAQMANMTGIVESFLGLAKLKQELDESKSREASNYAAAENAFAGASNQRSQASLNHTIKTLSKRQMSQIDKNIELMSEQAISEKRKQRLYLVQSAIHSAEKKQLDLKNALSDSFEKKFGYKADSDTINSLMLIASQVVSSAVSSAFDIFNIFKGAKKTGKNSGFIPFSEVTGNVD